MQPRLRLVSGNFHQGPGEMDGFSLAQQVRERYPQIDVILTSGASKAATKAGELCDEGPLEKPYHP